MSRELAAMEPERSTGRGGGPRAAVPSAVSRFVEALRAERGVTRTRCDARGGSRRTLRAGSSQVLSYESRSFRQRREEGRAPSY